MRQASFFHALGLTVLIVGAFACGSGNERRPATVTGPTPVTAAPTPASPTPPTPAGGPIRLTVTNGWTDAPVAQAVVTMDGATAVTDQSGQFELATSGACVRATVVAPGYLERRLACLPTAASQGRVVVTLWPVENDAERAALEAFAFPFGKVGRNSPQSVAFAAGIANRHDVIATWQAASTRLRTATSGWLDCTTLNATDLGDDGVVVSPFATLADCNHNWFPWPYAASGFCMQTHPAYFVAVARTDPARIATEGMALRVLMYSNGLRPHPLPGVLNATRPDDTLSDFEQRTLHMIGLRTAARPNGVAWPDTEF